jgi:polysaccharide export outer membrane protein
MPCILELFSVVLVKYQGENKPEVRAFFPARPLFFKNFRPSRLKQPNYSKNKTTRSVFLFLLLLALGFAPQALRSQTKSEIEQTVRGMSQDEIDRRLKELGMTRQEAIERAKENGINVEDYLARFQTSPATPESNAKTAAAPLSVQPRFVTPVAPKVSLPVEVPGFVGRPGVQGLKPFGYDVFNYPASTFEPVLNIATPMSYVLGPGDELVLTVWGETKLYYSLTVNRDGNLLIPEVGPISAAGQTIQQFKERLLRRMTSAYSGLKNGAPSANTFLDVSLGKLRTIQVFVLGEVVKPGGYSVSSLSTAFQALYLAGGPTINGTLRDIKVMRTGEPLPAIDFYDYLILGDKSKDQRLQDGDVIFVRPAGKRVALAGRVVRPAIYEIKPKESLGDLITLGGGLPFDAFFNRIHIERIIPFDQRKDNAKNILDIDLEFENVNDLRKSPYALVDGDIVTVPTIADLPQNRVTIEGNVMKPGIYEWKPAMRVRDLIFLADSLQRNTFSERGTLFRLLPNLRREVYPFNPRLAITGDESNNLVLQNEDSLVVYQESEFFPQRSVKISGAVHHPGTYPRYDRMTVGDLVVLAGGITESASLNGWEVARLDTTELGIYSRIYKFNVVDEYWNDANGARFGLVDYDQVTIPFNPKFMLQKSVTIAGYVMYPGTYVIKSDEEKINDIVKRAGGLKIGYYLDGSRLIRRENGAGLVPVDFARVLKDPTSLDNIRVVDGDSIDIAGRDNVVYVRGYVFVPSAVVYKKGASLSYYIHQAGGYREDADEGRTVVTLPNGRKWDPGWAIFPDPDILGGSTILVPQKIEKPDNTLQVISNFATIIASLAAISIAIVQVTK